MATVDIAKTLSFTGMRGGEMEAVTVPALISPKGHPSAIIKDGKACYPWAGGGNTVATAGLRKRSTVRGIFGAEWATLVTQERLRQAESLDADGNPIPYTCDAPRNGTRWVVTNDGDRLAFKTNADESALYATIVVARSMGYTYHTADGSVVDASVVAPFLRDRGDEGKRQGVSDPLVYRDYRAENVACLSVGKAVAWGEAKMLAEALANGGEHPTARNADGSPITVRQIADTFAPNVGEGVTG
jgi:hypothetical protein